MIQMQTNLDVADIPALVVSCASSAGARSE